MQMEVLNRIELKNIY